MWNMIKKWLGIEPSTKTTEDRVYYTDMGYPSVVTAADAVELVANTPVENTPVETETATETVKKTKTKTAAKTPRVTKTPAKTKKTKTKKN